MPDLPMKHYWYGEDIDKMPREQLIKIISTLARELNETREYLAEQLRRRFKRDVL